MTREELNKEVQDIYNNYDAGNSDSGDALLDVVELVEKYSKESTFVIPTNNEPECEYGEYLISELNNSLNQFGVYTFQDKGPHEVLHISKYVNHFKSMEVNDVATILTYVLDKSKYPQYSEDFVNAIIGDLDSVLCNFDTIFDYDDRFEY